MEKLTGKNVLLLCAGLFFLWAGCDSGGGYTRIPEQDYLYELPEDYVNEFGGTDYIHPDDINRRFPGGHTLMDYWADFIYNDCFETTFNSLKSTGAQHVIHVNWASYTGINPPHFSLIESTDPLSFRSTRDAEIMAMANAAKSRNMDFVLMLELNYDLAYEPGPEGWNWDEYRQFIESTISFLNTTGDTIDNNPDDDFASTFWDNWFNAYFAEFVEDQALLAESCGASMLVIGKQLAGAIRTSNAGRWRDLVAEVRSVYTGKIGYAGIITGNMNDTLFHEAGPFPIDVLDALVLVPWADIHTADDPSFQELDYSFTRLHDTVYSAMNIAGARVHNPDLEIIYLAPFMSCTGAPRQEWFEPAAHANPVIEQDLLIQAKMYEAFFQSVSNREWVNDIWSWGYWWRNLADTMFTYGDSSFDRASSLRNKPAIKIFGKWTE